MPLPGGGIPRPRPARAFRRPAIVGNDADRRHRPFAGPTMNAHEAFARLRRLGIPVIETADAAAGLQQSTYAASKTLSRLAESELVTQVRHGTWWIDSKVDAYRLAEYLTAP